MRQVYQKLMYEPVITTYRREADGAYVRRMIKLLCLKIGFSSNSIDSILLMLTEILTNVSKHANTYAQITAKPIKKYDRISGIEVSVKDTGPGIENLEQAMIDGYSTAGSLGLGLGALIRLSDNYQIETYPSSKFRSSGTQIKFEKLLRSKPYYLNPKIMTMSSNLGNSVWNIDGNSEKREGSRYNGDAIFWKNTDQYIFAAILDGVGHGYQAYEASQQALKTIKDMEFAELDEIMTKLHHEISETVGCQIGLLRIDKETKRGVYLIVGNIRAFLISSSSIRSLLSKDGTVGRHLPSLKTQEINFQLSTTLILHTDGISRVWVSKIKNSQFSKDISVGGDVLRKHRKKRDDSSYILIRNR